jgi:hypothetical protein
MDALIDVLRALTVVGAAIVAGGQLFCLLAVLPAMPAWAGEMSVKVHQDALTHRPHRYLRAVSGVTVLAAVALLVLIIVEDETTSARVFTGAGLAILIVSGLVSSREWPINEEINGWGEKPDLGRYATLRHKWDSQHVVRTWLSMAALVCFVISAVVATQ